MKTNYREIEQCCVSCKYFETDSGLSSIHYCGKNLVIKSTEKAGEMSDELYAEMVSRLVTTTGICDEWEKIEDIYD